MRNRILGFDDVADATPPISGDIGERGARRSSQRMRCRNLWCEWKYAVSGALARLNGIVPWAIASQKSAAFCNLTERVVAQNSGTTDGRAFVGKGEQCDNRCRMIVIFGVGRTTRTATDNQK